MKLQFKTPYVLTEEVDMQLRKLAARLPKVKRINTKGKYVKSVAVTKKRGQELLDAGINNYEGKPIDPKKFYRMAKPVVVHHYPNIVENYRLGGQEAVFKYCKSVKNAWYRQQPFGKKLRIFWAGLLLIFKPKKKAPVATGAPDNSK